MPDVQRNSIDRVRSDLITVIQAQEQRSSSSETDSYQIVDAVVGRPSESANVWQVGAYCYLADTCSVWLTVVQSNVIGAGDSES